MTVDDSQAVARTDSDIAVLDVSNISKSFGHVRAVQSASLAVKRGEIVGVVGDNGAGKSTLVKLIGGVLRPDAGRISYLGEPVVLRDVSDARGRGIEVVHQDLGLCQQLAIYQNVFLGTELQSRGLLRRRAMRRRTRELLEEYGIGVRSVDDPASDLSGGQRQLVALVRLVLREVKLAVLDEPTAALSVRASSQVYDMIRNLAGRGVGVLLVSHNLEDVRQVCDSIVIVRRGKTIAHIRARETTGDELIGLITGLLSPEEYALRNQSAAANGLLS